MSLPARIFVLILALLSMNVAIDAYDLLQARATKEVDLHAGAANLAQTSVLDLERAFEGARQVLHTLSNVSALRDRDLDACTELLRATVADLPMYDFIGVVGLNGEILCGSNIGVLPPGVRADQWQVDAAVSNRDFVVGYYGRSNVSGANVVRLSYPIRGRDGSVTGVLLAGLGLDWLNATVAQWGLPKDAVVTIADKKGIILARYPRPERIAQEISPDLRAPLDAWTPGFLTGVDREGVARVYGYTPVDIGRPGGVFVAVGLDRAAAVAELNRTLLWDLGWFLGLLIPAAVLSWVYVRHFVKRPIRHLLAAAASWQGGDWAARAKSNSGVPEFDRLAGAFDIMAEAVAAREAMLKDGAASLQRSQDHLTRAQRVAAIGSFEVDLKTNQIESSDETYRIFGLSRESGRLTPDIIEASVIPEDREVAKKSFSDARAGIRGAMPEYRIRRPDGAVRTIYREIEPMLDASGGLIGYIGVIKDVTELREAERQRDEFQSRFLQAQKMEAIGTLAGGIAHDLNNVLLPVIALSSLTMKRLPRESRDRQNLELIHEAGTRAHDLVRRILIFARKNPLNRRRVDIAAFAAAALKLLRSTLPTTISVSERLEPVPPIWADEGQLHQVVMNLVTNAAHAIGDQMGTITVEVALVSNASPESRGPAVRLSVIDTGCGMDDATRQRVFEPFFTTKGISEGTGLGLSIVHGIVSDHGGSITVISSPGQGARFDIFIPVVDGDHAVEESAA
jgi:PAS domain S-box-containing protein